MRKRKTQTDSTSTRSFICTPPANSKGKLQAGGKLSPAEDSGTCSPEASCDWITSDPEKRECVPCFVGEIDYNLVFCTYGRNHFGYRRGWSGHFCLRRAGQRLSFLSGMLGNVVHELREVKDLLREVEPAAFVSRFGR